jgi:hypothetical protein
MMDGTMCAWILILLAWFALCSLILHDATKEDSDGSAVLLAARKIKAFGFQKARRIRRALHDRTSHSGVPKVHVKAVPKVNANSSSPEAIRQGKRSVENQATAPAPKKKWWSKDGRSSMTAPDLEMAIAEAVKRTAPGCAGFIGVIVQRKMPKSHLEPNWAVRGAKFGTADRKVAAETLATIVERMQREFVLRED